MTQDISQALGFDVSRETVERLERYAQLIRKWNPTINLVSKPSLADLWDRHIVDSGQIFAHIPAESRLCLDIGSGGGLPGIVLAAISAELAPERRFTLVESDQRKATFLREAVRELGLKAEIKPVRVEALDPFGADLLTARALAPLSRLLAIAQQHLSADGFCLFPKGETYLQELEDARKAFAFECEPVQSVTDPKGAILKIHGIRNV